MIKHPLWVYPSHECFIIILPQVIELLGQVIKLTDHISGCVGTQAGDLRCKASIVGEGAAGRLARVSHHHCDAL